MANAPEHEFEPLYVPVIVIVVRSTWAMPVALDEHPDDIMLLVGMSIVNAMSSPDIVPRKDPGIRPASRNWRSSWDPSLWTHSA